MKHMRSIWICMLLFTLCILGAVACGKTLEQLSVPQDLKLEDEVLTWNKVLNAESYVVSVNGEEFETEENSLDLFEIMVSPDTVYEIKVCAYGKFFSSSDSEWSEPISYYVPSFVGTGTLFINEIDNGRACEIYGKGEISGKLIIPDAVNGLSVERIKSFKGLTEITGIYLPDSVSEIDKNAFSDCTKLSRVRISNSVKEIPSGAFYGCKALKRIKLPASLFEINRKPFEGCENLEKITVDPDNPDLWSEGNCVIRTRDNALLLGCKESVIPEGVTSIEGAFNGCKSLQSIVIPDSVTSIGQDAFNWCSNLTELTLPDRLTSLDSTALWCCEKLESIRFPASLTELIYHNGGSGRDWEGYPLFYRCDSLKRVEVDAQNPVYRSEGNCVIRKADNTMIAGCISSEMPSVEAIGDMAFWGVAGLGVLQIPYGVKRIGNRVFNDCVNLKTILIPDSVESIGTEIFSKNFELNSVVIPESVKTIPANAILSTAYVSYKQQEQPEGWVYGYDEGYGGARYWSSSRSVVWGCELAYEDHYPYVVSIICIGKWNRDEGVTSEEYTFGRGIEDLKIPMRAGYRFAGWALEEGGPVVYEPWEEETYVRPDPIVSPFGGQEYYPEENVRGEMVSGHYVKRTYCLREEDMKSLPAYTKLYAVWEKE